jgi:hypothetical protein
MGRFAGPSFKGNKMLVEVKAKFGFDHDGAKKRGDKFFVSPTTARIMARRGLVDYVDAKTEAQQNPTSAAGLVQPSSALPAAQASRKPIATPSSHGVNAEALRKAVSKKVQPRGRSSR